VTCDNDLSGGEMGEGDVLVLRVERRLVEPSAPRIDFGLGQGREEFVDPMLALEGGVLWLAPR